MPLVSPSPELEPATQAGKLTGGLLLCGMTPSQVSHTSQGVQIFTISPSSCSLLAYRNAAFCMLTFYPVIALNFLSILWSFLYIPQDSVDNFIVMKQDNFSSSFPVFLYP